MPLSGTRKKPTESIDFAVEKKKNLMRHIRNKLRSYKKENFGVIRKKYPSIASRIQYSNEKCALSAKVIYDSRSTPNLLFNLNHTKEILLYEHDDIIASANTIMESWNLESQDIIFFLGFGLGYYPFVAANRFTSKPTIVVIEPQVDMLRLSIKLNDLRTLFNYPNLDLLIGDEISIAGIIEKYRFQFFLGKQRVVIQPAYRKIFGENFCNLEKQLVESIGLAKDLWKTTRELGKRMFDNTIKNLPSLFMGNCLGWMKGCFSGITAICVAAGPSLDTAIPTLKKMVDCFLIVAMDSAVAGLIDNGIRPHIVVTCDSREVNFEKLRPFLADLQDTILIFALESNPDNVKLYPSEKRIAVSENNAVINQWLGPCLGIQTQLPAMTTVSHAAVFSMMELGADPIVLVGMDMAFPQGKSHAESAIHTYSVQADGMTPIEGTNGMPVSTYRPLIDYRRQLEMVIQNSNTRIVNTCLNGALIQGAEIRKLEEIAESKRLGCQFIKEKIACINWNRPINEEKIIEVIKWLVNNLQACLEDLENIVKRIDHEKKRIYADDKAINIKEIESTLLRIENRFNLKHESLINILNILRLESIRRVELQKIRLKNEIVDNAVLEKKLELLDVVSDGYRSYYETVKGCRAQFIEMEENYKKIQIKNKEYLSIIPNNPEARHLEQRLAVRLNACRRDVPINDGYTIPIETLNQLILKTKQLLENGQLERAVGILEFLDVAVAESNGIYRKKIAEIRSLQEDWESAAWHRKKALRSVIKPHHGLRETICPVRE